MFIHESLGTMNNWLTRKQIFFQNCELVENTTLLTNSMYHLNELSLTDCIKVPENVFSLMARRLSQEPLGDTEQDAIMNSLMIQYKKDTTGKLLPPFQCSSHEFVKSFSNFPVFKFNLRLNGVQKLKSTFATESCSHV